MTEAEAIEALSDMASNASDYFAIFMSINFAYLTAAYLVGATLKRFQCVVITGVYATSAALTGSTTVGWSQAWINLRDRENTIVDTVWIFNAMVWIGGLILILVSIVLGSLYFMYDIRRGAADA